MEEKKNVSAEATEELNEEGRRDFVTKAIGAVLAAGVVGNLFRSEEAQAADPVAKQVALPAAAPAFKLQSLPNGAVSKLAGVELAKLLGHESFGSQLAGKNMSVSLTWD